MAKKSKIAKNEQRKKLVARYARRRAELVAISKDPNASFEDKIAAQTALGKLPRNSSATRVVNRCVLTGRPRAYYRKFGLSRIALRDEALKGNLPGVVKASW
ncbi:MAG: 30S ribosomal protein S14 [Myxococcales bacterium]|nr:30S ribosomal protein S14 [Myxococcales bacterium]